MICRHWLEFVARLRLVFSILTSSKGMVSRKITAFPFQKAATNSVRLNVSKFVRGCADHKALNGRSETGSETEQVGSGMNERRRSGARFWNAR